MIRYVCKYTPVEIFSSFGQQVSLYNPTPDNLDSADELIHRNVCSFSRALLSSFPEDDHQCIVLTECCDSIRRICDIFNSQGKQTIMLPLPRRHDSCARQLFAKELIRLVEELEAYFGKPFSIPAFREAFQRVSDVQGPYIAVMGSRLGDDLLKQISLASPLPVRNHTCTGPRKFSPPSGNTVDEVLTEYAGELLNQPSCMRMSDLSSRRQFTQDPNLQGIVYSTVKFCDFYHFEYADLLASADLPIVKIETDYTPQGTAQVLTRLQAFFEGLPMQKRKQTATISRDSIQLAAGVDSGSTTTNAVILDSKKNILSYATIPTGVQIESSAAEALAQALGNAGLQREDLDTIVTTGYGRGGISFRKRDITEITCHAKGAFFLNPAVRTVIDIGGQDSKVIRINEQGGVEDFVMNDKCAAGTGKFLEMMADSLGLSTEEMSRRGKSSQHAVAISSMCSVFAQSEVVSLIADGKDLEDIVRGIHRSIAVKVTSLAGRRELQLEWMVTGGVAKNTGVITALEERLHGRVIRPEEPQICGALGAALLALEQI